MIELEYLEKYQEKHVRKLNGNYNKNLTQYWVMITFLHHLYSLTSEWDIFNLRKTQRFIVS